MGMWVVMGALSPWDVGTSLEGVVMEENTKFPEQVSEQPHHYPAGQGPCGKTRSPGRSQGSLDTAAPGVEGMPNLAAVGRPLCFLTHNAYLHDMDCLH